MNELRLLADDLTGALDSAARFVPRVGPIPVFWRAPRDTPAAAFDSGTRDAADPEPALLRWAPHLRDADVAFKKLDSLLRGHVAAEIAACIRLGGFSHAIIAPAFPAQGRITRGGRQFAHGTDVGVDLDLELARLGIPVSHCRPGDPASPGVSLWDAVDDGDLDLIAAAGRRLPRPVLWCGTGGLAGALCGGMALELPPLKRPILALVGSDHPIAAAQFEAAPQRAAIAGADPIARRLGITNVALRVAVPDGTGRAAAARHIAKSFAAVMRSIPPPGTLMVTGGETLRGLCEALGVDHLVVRGEHAPGIPVSRMAGGRWDGLTVVSKSGAFGRPDFLRNLLAE